MLQVDIGLVGDKELERALSRLPFAVQVRLVKRGLAEAAKPVLWLAKSLAPKRTGRLAQSLSLGPIRRRRDYIGVSVTPGTRAQLGIPRRSKWYYPIHQELGTRRHPRHAYLKPAADRSRDYVIKSLAGHVWAAIREEMPLISTWEST